MMKTKTLLDNVNELTDGISDVAHGVRSRLGYNFLLFARV